MAEPAQGGEPPFFPDLVEDRLRAGELRRRAVAQREQLLIDAEVRETRRMLLRAVQRRGAPDSVAFLDEDFMSVADRPTIHRAILHAALTVGGAERADLQLYDPGSRTLIMAAHRGFSREFTTFFATVDAGAPTACAAALTARTPVLIDDVSRSAIFVGRPTLEPLLSAGSRAVYSYPLIGAGQVQGVLSFHRRGPAPRLDRTAFVAHCAGLLLTRSQGGSGPFSGGR